MDSEEGRRIMFPCRRRALLETQRPMHARLCRTLPESAPGPPSEDFGPAPVHPCIRQISLLRLSPLRLVDSRFPENSMDMIIPPLQLRFCSSQLKHSILVRRLTVLRACAPQPADPISAELLHAGCSCCFCSLCMIYVCSCFVCK